MTALIALAVGLFVTTDLDDLFVLVAFFSDARFRPRQIAAGQLAGLAALYAASVVFSLLSLVVAPAWIGFLGLLPIAIGLHAIAQLLRGDDSDDDDAAADANGAGGRANVLVVAATTIANGGDNLGIYTPVFATRSGTEIAVIGVVFAAMTMVWVGAASRRVQPVFQQGEAACVVEDGAPQCHEHERHHAPSVTADRWPDRGVTGEDRKSVV